MGENRDVEATLIEVKKQLEESVQRSEEIIQRLDHISLQNFDLASRVNGMSMRNVLMPHLSPNMEIFLPQLRPQHPSAPAFPYLENSSTHIYETLRDPVPEPDYRDQLQVQTFYFDDQANGKPRLSIKDIFCNCFFCLCN